MQYKDDSIAAMILWQALGGRADTYNFESFYTEGPHTVIPESNPISYTGLVYCGLRSVMPLFCHRQSSLNVLAGCRKALSWYTY